MMIACVSCCHWPSLKDTGVCRFLIWPPCTQWRYAVRVCMRIYLANATRWLHSNTANLNFRLRLRRFYFSPCPSAFPFLEQMQAPELPEPRRPERTKKKKRTRKSDRVEEKAYHARLEDDVTYFLEAARTREDAAAIRARFISIMDELLPKAVPDVRLHIVDHWYRRCTTDIQHQSWTFCLEDYDRPYGLASEEIHNNAIPAVYGTSLAQDTTLPNHYHDSVFEALQGFSKTQPPSIYLPNPLNERRVDIFQCYASIRPEIRAVMTLILMWNRSHGFDIDQMSPFAIAGMLISWMQSGNLLPNLQDPNILSPSDPRITINHVSAIPGGIRVEPIDTTFKDPKGRTPDPSPHLPPGALFVDYLQ
ncbi:uncharacterized protein EI90DRAFT_1007633 [Cantharellus anzutake]|uniref:uncharacterized protein n=1 Tax=Cantharellus anzutake TaxID=1750568 RepID=UPI0019041655|nr:uncharacterized protein EI90DRAFT_1007633 [Cantharellus anzutake]KAF8331315.1 hypothetical protein EI90DRAFT_1007633 [Cantharellus anzutake]